VSWLLYLCLNVDGSCSHSLSSDGMKLLLFVDFVMTGFVGLFSGNFDVKKEVKKEVWEKGESNVSFQSSK
jgi:hypothetical protein